MIDFEQSKVYVNARTRKLVNKLVDLFCLQDVDVIFRINKRDGLTGYTTNFVGYDTTDPKKPNQVFVGSKGGIRASIIIHEFLHVAGYDHQANINETHNFRHISYECIHMTGVFKAKPNEVDNYSRLICKDIFGKYEVIL